MGKERLFYLDFIRAIAAIMIVITHYNAVYLYAEPQITNCFIIHAFIFNIYIGGFGVSLFLIISGAALMYVYGDHIDIRKFYFKRWKSLFPMFWLAYIVTFSYAWIYSGAWKVTQMPRWHIIISILGMDGFLADKIQTFYLVGEWFLGFIILFYIVFPALRYMINKHPYILAVLSLTVYFGLIIHYPWDFNPTKDLLIRLPELLFGMYFIKYIKRVNLPTAIISLGIIVANSVIKPTFSTDLQTTYIGIASFLVLVYISQFVTSKNIMTICAWISKYSYAIFLVHHYVIYVLMATFDLYSITQIESYLIFIGLLAVVFVLSKILFEIDGFIGRWTNKGLSLLKKNQ